MTSKKCVHFLVVDDNHDNLLSIKTELEKSCNNLKVDLAYNIRDGLRLHGKHEYTLVAINIMLSEKSPLLLLSTLRATANTYIVVLLPERDEQTAVSCYESGADYVLCPPDTLEMNIAFLRSFYCRQTMRSNSANIGSTLIFQERLVLNTAAHEVYVDNRLVNLTAKEYKLLCYLARNSDQLLSIEQILLEVWDYDDMCTGVLRSIITRLRRKIEPNPKQPTFIKSVYGSGYKLCSKHISPS